MNGGTVAGVMVNGVMETDVQWQRNDTVGVVSTSATGTLAHPHGWQAGPSRHDANEREHGVDVALHRVDVGEASLLRHLQRGTEEVHLAAACELARPLLLRRVHGGSMLVTWGHGATVGARGSARSMGLGRMWTKSP